MASRLRYEPGPMYFADDDPSNHAERLATTILGNYLPNALQYQSNVPTPLETQQAMQPINYDYNAQPEPFQFAHTEPDVAQSGPVPGANVVGNLGTGAPTADSTQQGGYTPTWPMGADTGATHDPSIQQAAAPLDLGKPATSVISDPHSTPGPPDLYSVQGIEGWLPPRYTPTQDDTNRFQSLAQTIMNSNWVPTYYRGQ